MLELTPQQQQFVDAQVAAGNFSEPAEVVDAAMELLRQTAQREYDETVQDIRQGLKDFEDGNVQPLAEAMDDIRSELGLSK